MRRLLKKYTTGMPEGFSPISAECYAMTGTKPKILFRTCSPRSFTDLKFTIQNDHLKPGCSAWPTTCAKMNTADWKSGKTVITALTTVWKFPLAGELKQNNSLMILFLMQHFNRH